MVAGVVDEAKGRTGPLRLNVTLHEFFCRISDALAKISSTWSSLSGMSRWWLTVNERVLCAPAGSTHISRPRHTIAMMVCIFILAAATLRAEKT